MTRLWYKNSYSFVLVCTNKLKIMELTFDTDYFNKWQTNIYFSNCKNARLMILG